MRFAFAGDRDISVQVLDFVLASQHRPLALLVSEPGRATHAQKLIERCGFLGPGRILRGREFRSVQGIDLLRSLELDFIIGVHFPYMVPQEVLRTPRRGVLNLHPAFLPYNRGWHTPSWAILERTPMGATLHFMDVEVDAGDIVHQRQIDTSPGDTANSLYERVKRLELEVFREAWPLLVSGQYKATPQAIVRGTTHRRADLLAANVQRIDLDQRVTAGDLLRRIRALTTDRVGEAAYYEVDGRRYRVQVVVTEEQTR